MNAHKFVVDKKLSEETSGRAKTLVRMHADGRLQNHSTDDYVSIFLTSVRHKFVDAERQIILINKFFNDYPQEIFKLESDIRIADEDLKNRGFSH